MKNPYSERKYVNSVEEMPDGEHFAILIFSSHMSPGYDEGEPSYSSPHVEYIAFTSREAWEEYITKLEAEKYSPKKYKAIIAKTVTVKSKVVVML